MAWLSALPRPLLHTDTAGSSHLNTSQHGLALFVSEECRICRIEADFDQLDVLHSRCIFKYIVYAGAGNMQSGLTKFRPTFWGRIHDEEGWPQTWNPAGIVCANHWPTVLIQTSLLRSFAYIPQVSTYSSDHLSAGSSGIQAEDGGWAIFDFSA